MPSLEIAIDSGLVVGFADTFPLSDRSTAQQIAQGANGGKEPVLKWLGVPYAQAARWERPTPPAPWTAPLKAWEFGTMFPQSPGEGDQLYAHQPGVLKRDWVTQSEDSHSINVFAPEGTKAEDKLPVLVWIYGGGLNFGSSGRFLYDPTEWIRRSAANGKRFIVVTGNYRVNIFGFFSSPALLAQDPSGLSGNYGLYDCVAMLEWVQRNISAFGGDAGSVTAFGESAGAFLISHLLVSRRRLFQRAIIESAASDTLPLRPVSVAYPAHSALDQLHAPGASPTEALSALRALSATDLLAAHVASSGLGGLGLTIETGQRATWDRGTLSKLQEGKWDAWIDGGVMLGTNENEGSLFALGGKLQTPQAFAGLVSTFPASVQPAIAAKYKDTPGDPSLIFQNCAAAKLLADQMFVFPVWDQAVALSSRGEGREKVWMYRCRAQVDRISKGPIKLGVMHIIEIPLVFNTSSLWEKGAHEEAASKVFGDCWADFAIKGVPHPDWQPFTPDAPSWFTFSDTGVTANESIAGFDADRVDLSRKRA